MVSQSKGGIFMFLAIVLAILYIPIGVVFELAKRY